MERVAGNYLVQLRRKTQPWASGVGRGGVIDFHRASVGYVRIVRTESNDGDGL